LPENESDLHLRVAAVCYRRTPAGPEFLLVRTWDGEWTFPKGMIDPGATEIETAETEAWEEAGVRGAIDPRPFATYRADKDSKSSGAIKIQVAAYLLEVRSTEPPQENHRKPQWFDPDAAKKALADGRSEKRAREFDRVISLAVQKISSS